VSRLDVASYRHLELADCSVRRYPLFETDPARQDIPGFHPGYGLSVAKVVPTGYSGAPVGAALAAKLRTTAANNKDIR
jgi:hypothetical protein